MLLSRAKTFARPKETPAMQAIRKTKGGDHEEDN